MKRVMIVDDEKMIRDGLTHLIDWEAFGYQITAQAADGRQALEYLLENPVDLVLTDIRMPYLDGIEFARRVRRERPATRIVFVSGYDDFSLIREALQMGACDYLLKPLEPELLTDVLQRIGKDIEERALSEEEAYRVRRDAEQARQIRRQKLLKRLTLEHQSISDEEFALLEAKPEQAYALLLVEIDHYYARYASLNAEQLGLVQDRLLEELRALAAPTATTFDLGDGRYGLCLIDDQDALGSACGALTERLTHLKCSGDTLTVYLGGQTSDPRQISALYLTALQNRENCFAPSNNEMAWAEAEKEVDLTQACDAVIEAVGLGDTSLLHQQMQKLEATLTLKGGQSFLYGQVMFANLYAQAIRCVANMGGSISEVFDDPMKEYRAVFNGQSLRQAAAGIENLLHAVAEYVRMSGSGDTRAQVCKAKRYIDNHLRDSTLCMQRVAEEFAMSPGYFSTAFHKLLGYTFTEYLNMARIQRAGELLRHSQLRVYEVAEAVGYENTTYFSTLFRRHYGVSPKQYRG